jgi:hypothetical protein
MEMKRTVLEFSVRSKDIRTLDEVSTLIGKALGCSFCDGEIHKIPARVALLLGMLIGVYKWRGQNSESIFRLHTDVGNDGFFRAPEGQGVEIEIVDISQAIIDLLDVSGAGEWYVPSKVDVTAEVEYSYEVDRQFQVSDEQIREWEAGG